MAYDTMLRPDDPFDRRLSPVYGSPPGGVTREQAASEDAAKRFARRRVLMGIQGGLGAGIEAGGGFFGNLLRGASGSLGGTLQANQMQHEEERQAIRDQGEQQQAEEARRRWEATFGLDKERLGIQKDQETRLSLAETRRQRDPRESEFDRWLRMTPAERKQYREFKNISDNPPGAEKPPKLREDVLDRLDIINQMDPHNPEHAQRLQAVLKNPATKEEYEAAKRKLEVPSMPGAFWRTPAPPAK